MIIFKINIAQIQINLLMTSENFMYHSTALIQVRLLLNQSIQTLIIDITKVFKIVI